MDPEHRKTLYRLGSFAVALLAGVVIAILIRAALDTDAEASPASADTTLTEQVDQVEVDGEMVPACRRRVLDSEITPAGRLKLAIRNKTSRFKALEPATDTDGGAALTVASSFRVSCDLDSGRISHRGGFQIAVGIRGMSFKKIVVNASDKMVTAVSTRESGTDYNAFALQTDRIEKVDLGNELEQIEVPLALTPEGAAAMNVKLQTDLFTIDQTILTLRLTTQAISDQADEDSP